MLAGAKCGGHPPYGFARQIFNPDGSPGRVLGVGERRGPDQIVRLVPGPADEVRIVRIIFRLFVDGLMGPTAIAHKLNADGTPYRRGHPWDQNRIRHVLKHEISVGLYSFNRSTIRFGTATRNDPAHWIKVRMVKPIISRTLYDAAQAKLKLLHRNMWTDDEMIQKLRLLLGQHGFITKTLMDRSPDVQGVSAYIRRFGSIEAAWALVPYSSDRPRRQHVDQAGRQPDEIVRRLKNLLEVKGFLNLVEVQNCPSLPSVKFICQTFGSLTNAYRAAGFDLTRGEMVLAGKRRGGVSKDAARYMTVRPGAVPSRHFQDAAGDLAAVVRTP
jgi:hypothetical protein